DVRHTPDHDRHQPGGHLVVAHVAGQEAIEEEADLLDAVLQPVPLAADDLDHVHLASLGYDSRRAARSSQVTRRDGSARSRSKRIPSASSRRRQRSARPPSKPGEIQPPARRTRWALGIPPRAAIWPTIRAPRPPRATRAM